MIHAYDRSYLPRAQKSLGRMLDFACHELGFPAADFWALFLSSGVATRFGSGESRLLAGMSGIELAYEVLDRADVRYRRVAHPVCADEKTSEYWVGWALAHYQWQRAVSFEEIEAIVPIEGVLAMYSPFHEMDISQFVDELDRRYRVAHPDSRLKEARQRSGLSQGQLAEASGISIRTIQELEQRRKDINKAQLDTMIPLARALHVPVERLTENIP